MMICRRGMTFLILIFFAIAAASQQLPATLLWRISGKGLTKPSYLYGTMHLQDKRLFNFGDSVYSNLASVEGFALEIDFRDLLDSMFAKQIAAEEDRIMEDAELTLDRKKLGKGSDSLLKKFGIHGNNISKKDLKKIRDYRISQMMQQGEMQTIVDGYLYGLALRQSKWIGGIEDIHDQLDLMDEIGNELTPDNVFQPDAAMKKSLEEMIQVYLRADLVKLSTEGEAGDNEWRDRLLIQRNLKMSRRMDSLMSIRSMFFAIGAAHLAGDSGVISLLQKRGFRVDPVFSSGKIAGETYIKTLDRIAWSKVQDEENLYTILMPGKPSDYNMMGQAVKMKIFFDLPTMTFYMTGTTISGNNLQSDLDRIFQGIAERMDVNASAIKRKNIDHNGVHGFEGSFEAPQGFYRVQLLQKGNTLFMLMAGSPKKVNLQNEDAAHFFNSFQAGEVTIQKRDWVKFTLPEKAFSVMLPGQPHANKVIDKNAEASGWYFTTYDYIDNGKGLYYVIQVRDILRGYFLQGDSSYFSLYKADFEKRLGTVLRSETTLFEGFPAFQMDVKSEKENLYYKVYNVIRGNRVYVLMVGGQGQIDSLDAISFFKSFQLIPYQPSEWKTQHQSGFYTTVPAPITKEEPGEEEDGVNPREHFVSYNSAEAISYEVFRDTYDSLYWAESDSVFFDERIKTNLSFGDSLLKQSTVYNGGLRGIEFLVRKPDNNNLKRIRMFLNGDTLYTLITFIASQYADNKNHDRFFTDFRVINERQPTIYHNKAERLLKALQTKDSASFTRASSIFNMVTFHEKDRSLLHKALLYSYIRMEEGSDLHDRIVRAVKELADTSTVAFIERNYHSLDRKSEELKYPLLQLLASIHTRQSYDVLKKLLLSGLPEKGSSWGLADDLSDSLGLTVSLFPEILAFSNDSVFSYVLVAVTPKLVDSNLLNWKDVQVYEKNFLKQAGSVRNSLKAEEEEWWIGNFWISFIRRFNDKESNIVLREFVKVASPDLRSRALVALAGNNQPVNNSDLEKIAADPTHRNYLYDELKEIGKEKLFPPKYANQKSLAVSEMYLLANDEYQSRSVTFLSEKILNFEGRKMKFYLFRVTYAGEDNTDEAYLGITGPYEITGGGLITSSDASGVLMSEAYDRRNAESLVKQHLKEIEKYKREGDISGNKH